MKKIMRGAMVLTLVGLTAIVPGCSHSQALHGIKGDDDGVITPAAENQFLTDLSNQPASERSQYVQTHMKVLEAIKLDPDQSKIQKLLSLLPAKTP